MNTETNQPNTAVPAAPNAAPARGGREGGFRGGAGGRGGAGRGGPRRGGSREPRVKPEFDQKIIAIRRVSRTNSGGRRFNFSVAMVIGNKKGGVGVGLGKAGDTALAIDKAARNARKNMITIAMTKSKSIGHAVEAKYSSARVSIMPAKGRGIIAGTALRTVVELAGLNDVNAKVFSGSKNKLNIARAAVHALNGLSDKRKAIK